MSVDYRATALQLLETHGVDSALEQVLAQILESCFVHRLAPGEILCREGAPAEDLYFILQGSITVRMRDFLGLEQPMATLQAPSMLGHMGLVDQAPRSATCVAASRGQVAVLPSQRFQLLARELGPPGDVLRRLLLSAMSKQLSMGNAELKSIIARAQGEDSEVDQAELSAVTGTIKGWGSTEG